MIEDKEAYYNRVTELANKKKLLIEEISSVDAVESLMRAYGTSSLAELKSRLDAEYNVAKSEYDKFTHDRLGQPISFRKTEERVNCMTKEQLLEQCKNAKPIPGSNLMGCSESWYDPFFCLQQIFKEDELGAMSELELNNLYRLADRLTGVFY